MRAITMRVEVCSISYSSLHSWCLEQVNLTDLVSLLLHYGCCYTALLVVGMCVMSYCTVE